MTKKKNNGEIRFAELFAGVGGFRLGLEKASKTSKGPKFKHVWSNQWEPGTKVQHASNVYVARWGNKDHSNENIAKVDASKIPEHDILVGGFPCQDYSVARTLSQAEGIVGKKGVLWWEIHRILEKKKKSRPSILLLENVDRLLKSPVKRRGRDFAIMLASLSDLEYAVEWRVINAAEYGKPQRRRRIFILGYKKGTPIYKKISELKRKVDWIVSSGIFARTFPVTADTGLFDTPVKIEGDLVELSNSSFIRYPHFHNSGLMIDRNVVTLHTSSNYSGESINLGDIIQCGTEVPKEYYIPSKDIPRWKYLKGAKNELRRTGDGFEYFYTEGGMMFPDPLDGPSRTIITGEGGPTPSRFKHVIKTPSGTLRRLTPIELEKLNQFPPGHTKLEGISDVKRAFFMGNALVVGVVEDIGKTLLKVIK